MATPFIFGQPAIRQVPDELADRIDHRLKIACPGLDQDRHGETAGLLKAILHQPLRRERREDLPFVTHSFLSIGFVDQGHGRRIRIHAAVDEGSRRGEDVTAGGRPFRTPGYGPGIGLRIDPLEPGALKVDRGEDVDDRSAQHQLGEIAPSPSASRASLAATIAVRFARLPPEVSVPDEVQDSR